MELGLIRKLRDNFGDRYVSAEDLFRKSLNTVATPAMGHGAAVLWLIVDNARGEDIVRRHYEAMLRYDAEIDGIEKPIDPYNGPRELASRLIQQGYKLELTVLPPDFDKKEQYIELKHREMLAKQYDIQAVCYNLDNRVMPDEPVEPLKIDGINE
ncbi:hypothetical protein [Pseudomonas phage D6]|nr:hypothetical protein [Pseudomonas phage D6]